MGEDRNRYFRIEARELAEGLARGVLQLERGAGPEVVGDLLRKAHTLKGAARVVRQAALADLAHAIEDALAPWRDLSSPVPTALVPELLRLVDHVSQGVAALEAPTEGAGGTAASGTVPARADSAPALGDEAFQSLRIGVPEMDAVLEGLAEAGARLEALLPAAAELEAAGRAVGEIAALLEAAGDRVGTRSSDALQSARQARERLAESHRRLLEGLDRSRRDLARVGQSAGHLRLVAVDMLAGTLERAVRDASQELGRPARFEMHGGDTRIDGNVLAALRDALIHVVRNAVAHGIESPAVRRAAGKPAEGTVRLVVERRGGRIGFACTDDGGGVDVAAVAREAVRRGLIPEEAAAALAPEAAYRLLFRAGLSTTRTVTGVAGRGIGLDAVRDTVLRLKGDVDVASQRGKGTTFTLRVPVSLTALGVLEVEAGGVRALVPLDAVRRAARVADGTTSSTGGRETLLLDGVALPWVPLARLLGGDRAAGGQAPRLAVVVRWDEGSAALGVDRLLGSRPAVVRPLPWSAGRSAIVAGASLDAEGNPRAVLDPEGLVRAATEALSAGPAAAPRECLPILVVDDSLTTRMIEQAVLESAGYEVDAACSGEEGLARARQRRYGLFVVDVEMPGMNGFDFVRQTQEDPDLRSTPAIIVTSLGSAEDRQRGLEAGARAWVVKSEFEEGRFLQAVRDLAG